MESQIIEIKYDPEQKLKNQTVQNIEYLLRMQFLL